MEVSREGPSSKDKHVAEHKGTIGDMKYIEIARFCNSIGKETFVEKYDGDAYNAKEHDEECVDFYH